MKRSNDSPDASAAEGAGDEDETMRQASMVRPAADAGHSETARATPAGQLRGMAADGSAVIDLAGEEAHCDPGGGLWLPRWDALVLSDMHFEKASHFAEAGYLVPPYDTARTLDAVEAMVARRAPALVVSLGDAFHDPRGLARMGAEDRDRLEALSEARDWVWVAGNHDPGPVEGLRGETVAALELGALRLVHEPAHGPAPGEVAGHLHPVAKLVARRPEGARRVARGTPRGRAVRRPCFACDGARIVLPAIGAFTGGLSVCAAPFRPLFERRSLVAHMLGETRIYSVPGTSLC